MKVKEFTNKIINADCLEILKQLPDKCIDLVLTDFPYNVVNRKSNKLRNLYKGKADELDVQIVTVMNELIRICKGSFYAFCSTEQVSIIRQYLDMADFSTRLLIWEKTNPSPMNGEHIWLSGIECCVYGKQKGAVFNEFCKNTVLRYPICLGKDKIHDTQKPLDMFKYLIQVSSNKNDLVLDCFAGSGTTAIACFDLGRRFICIEKDKGYFDLAKERIDSAMAQKKLF